MSEWQKIKTAPRDGTLVLVGDSRAVMVARFDWKYVEWISVPGAWVQRPTHWMPLPPPPEES